VNPYPGTVVLNTPSNKLTPFYLLQMYRTTRNFSCSHRTSRSYKCHPRCVYNFYHGFVLLGILTDFTDKLGHLGT